MIVIDHLYIPKPGDCLVIGSVTFEVVQVITSFEATSSEDILVSFNEPFLDEDTPSLVYGNLPELIKMGAAHWVTKPFKELSGQAVLDGGGLSSTQFEPENIEIVILARPKFGSGSAFKYAGYHIDFSIKLTAPNSFKYRETK